MPAKVGIHVFCSPKQRRGWCAFAHHDGPGKSRPGRASRSSGHGPAIRSAVFLVFKRYASPRKHRLSGRPRPSCRRRPVSTSFVRLNKYVGGAPSCTMTIRERAARAVRPEARGTAWRLTRMPIRSPEPPAARCGPSREPPPAPVHRPTPGKSRRRPGRLDRDGRWRY